MYGMLYGQEKHSYYTRQNLSSLDQRKYTSPAVHILNGLGIGSYNEGRGLEVGGGTGGTQDGQVQMRSTVISTWHGVDVWVIEGSDRLCSPGLQGFVGGMQTKLQTPISENLVNIMVVIEEHVLFSGRTTAVILQFHIGVPTLNIWQSFLSENPRAKAWRSGKARGQWSAYPGSSTAAVKTSTLDVSVPVCNLLSCLVSLGV